MRTCEKTGKSLRLLCPPASRGERLPFWHVCAVRMKQSLGSLCGGRFQVREVCRNGVDAVFTKGNARASYYEEREGKKKKTTLQLFYSPATFTSNTCVSLPNRTSYIWSCAFRKLPLHPVLSIWCRYFVDILKLAPPYTQTHSHQLIPYSLKRKKKGNITTSCVSA